MAALSRKDGLGASLGAVAIILGVATGNGIAMFVICAIALALTVVFTPRTQLRSGLLIALVGAVVSICVLLAFFRIVPVELLR
jgi:4-hydroxybenzoate polyprenyltransferase